MDQQISQYTRKTTTHRSLLACTLSPCSTFDSSLSSVALDEMNITTEGMHNILRKGRLPIPQKIDHRNCDKHVADEIQNEHWSSTRKYFGSGKFIEVKAAACQICLHKDEKLEAYIYLRIITPVPCDFGKISRQ